MDFIKVQVQFSSLGFFPLFKLQETPLKPLHISAILNYTSWMWLLSLAGTLNVYIFQFTSVHMHLTQGSIIDLSPGGKYIWAIMPSIQKSVGFYSYNLFYYTYGVIGLDLYPLNLDLTPLTNFQSHQEVSRNQTCTYWLQHWVHY